MVPSATEKLIRRKFDVLEWSHKVAENMCSSQIAAKEGATSPRTGWRALFGNCRYDERVCCSVFWLGSSLPSNLFQRPRRPRCCSALYFVHAMVIHDFNTHVLGTSELVFLRNLFPLPWPVWLGLCRTLCCQCSAFSLENPCQLSHSTHRVRSEVKPKEADRYVLSFFSML